MVPAMRVSWNQSWFPCVLMRARALHERSQQAAKGWPWLVCQALGTGLQPLSSGFQPLLAVAVPSTPVSNCVCVYIPPSPVPGKSTPLSAGDQRTVVRAGESLTHLPGPESDTGLQWGCWTAQVPEPSLLLPSAVLSVTGR